MDVLLLRSLVAVADHGAITEAAAALGVSQSALSRRIDQLEEALGAPLLERAGRKEEAARVRRTIEERQGVTPAPAAGGG